MSRICDIYDKIDAVAPFAAAMSFDNVGLLVGDRTTEVTRALLTLDITPEVVEEAAAMNANLIISHHPVIFHPLKSLAATDVPYLLAQHGIAALCCHTNLDRSPVCGTNVALGECLSLQNVCAEHGFAEDTILFSGDLPQLMSPKEFAALVKEQLSAQAVFAIYGNRPVQKVFFCSGAGGDCAALAAQRGADAYLTGELHHHEALDAAKTDLTVVAAGHYETEKPVTATLAAYLKKHCKDIVFLQSKLEKPPLTVL